MACSQPTTALAFAEFEASLRLSCTRTNVGKISLDPSRVSSPWTSVARPVPTGTMQVVSPGRLNTLVVDLDRLDAGVAPPVMNIHLGQFLGLCLCNPFAIQSNMRYLIRPKGGEKRQVELPDHTDRHRPRMDKAPCRGVGSCGGYKRADERQVMSEHCSQTRPLALVRWIPYHRLARCIP